MSNAGPAEILQSFAALVDEAFTAPRGVKPAIAGDPARAVDLLTAGQMGGLAVVVFYEGDTAAGDDHWDPRVLATVRAVVLRRQGLGAGARGAEVLELAGELRRALSGAGLAGVLGGVAYQGMAPVQTAEGRMLEGYSLKFGVLYADQVRE